MNTSINQIGFSQRVRLEWFETTAHLVLAGNDKTAINEALQDLLRDKISIGGEAERGNREKIITILMKVWLNVPNELEVLRVDGLELLKRAPRTEHMVIHWGMVMAVYPFWAAVASHVGRFLRLQGFATATHIQRRIREQYGERETVSRAARRVLRSFIDWGVLTETGSKGVYGQGLSESVVDPAVALWLIEACLHTRSSRCASLKDLVGSTALFPFRIQEMAGDSLSVRSTRLEFLRHGLDDELVLLHNEDKALIRHR